MFDFLISVFGVMHFELPESMKRVLRLQLFITFLSLDLKSIKHIVLHSVAQKVLYKVCLGNIFVHLGHLMTNYGLENKNPHFH